jgi:hypothetical protein
MEDGHGQRDRPKSQLNLSDAERSTLERWARRPKSSQRLAQRSGIVLACVTGASNLDVADRLRVTPAMVGKWRGRFVAHRLDELVDEARPGVPRSNADDVVAEVIVTTLEELPVRATHDALAREAGRDLAGVGWKDLGRIRAPALARRELQAVDRPSVRRQR